MPRKIPGRALDPATAITVNNISFGSNMAINASSILVGNSTVNTTINSTAVFTPSVNVGSNVFVNTSTIHLGNSTVNTVVHTTGFTGNGAGLHSVNAAALEGNTVLNILTSANTAANTLASAAYSNAIAYSGNAVAAYTNATTFSANADNISSGTLNTARLPATISVSTAVNIGSNVNANTSAVLIGNSTVNTVISAETILINGVNINTAITSNAAAAYSNAISHSGNAVQAYNNAIAYAASNSYVNSTFLPLAGGTMTGNLTVNASANIVSNLSANNVTFRGNVQIDGNLVVSGTSVTLNVASFTVEDNILHLNNGSTDTHPDLGLAGNYNDGTYKHAGIFRDATDATWKVFDGYTPEPNTAFIDTSNASFRIANFTANVITGNSFVGNGASVTSVDAATVGGNTAATLRSYSDTVAATAFSNAALRADAAYSNAIAFSGNAALAFSNAAARADAAFSNATTFAANATNISSGTLNTARLPATVNVSTAVNVGANVNVNTSVVFVGNSTVNTSISAGTITINGVNVNNIITSNNVGTFGNTTINGFLNVTTNTATFGTAAYVVANGNIGVGTINPTDRIHLNGGVNASTGIIIGNNNSTRLRLFHDDAAGASYLSTHGVQTAQQLRIRSGDILAFDIGTTEAMRLTATANLALGTSVAAGERLRIKAANVTSSSLIQYLNLTNEADCDIVFQVTGTAATDKRAFIGTSPGSTSLVLGTGNSERVRIAANGNVGVAGAGSTSPAQLLHLFGTFGQPATSGATQNGILRVAAYNGGGSAGWGEVLDVGMHVGLTGPASYAWLQATNFGNHAINYRLALNPNGGNVGVNTTSPSFALDVGGTFRVTGRSDLNGQLVQGTGTARSTAGATFVQTINTNFAADSDIGDTGRFISIVNESTSGSAFAQLGFRVNPSGGSTNAMLDMKLENGGATNKSILHFSFLHSGSWFDRFRFSSDGSFALRGSAGTYTLDTSVSVATYADGATVDFPNFSGMILANDTQTTGYVTIYLVGGGNATAAASVGGQVGTMAYNSGVNGYRWTNNSGQSRSVSFAAFRTRNNA